MTDAQKKHIYGSLKEHGKALNRILQILENDDSIGEIGLVKEVKLNTKARMDAEKNDAVKAGKMTVYSAIGTVVVLVGWTVIKAFINSKVK